MVSILILTHNAPEYVVKTIESVAKYTRGVQYEVVVVDNASEETTRTVVQDLYARNLIHKLKLLEYNSLFAKGNNIAAGMASEEATHFLLLNSDIEVKSPDWLSNLLSTHRKGISSYGIIDALPLRVDGYCLLIDAKLYRKYQLDENFQWWWGVTKIQAQLLRDGYSVRGYEKHNRYLIHFGGKSGTAFVGAAGMDVSQLEVLSWFGDKSIVVENRSRAKQAKSLLKRVLGKGPAQQP